MMPETRERPGRRTSRRRPLIAAAAAAAALIGGLLAGALAPAHAAELLTNPGFETGALSPWTWGLPVGALALLALVVVGVRPRLAEYR